MPPVERKRFEDIDKWFVMKQALIEKGYKLWQTQYDWNDPEGFIAGFMCGDKRIEIVTHSEAIERDIINSSL